jgi:protein phosphatase
MNNRMRWESASITDRGLHRPNNEDSLLDDSEKAVFAVADGMGGHAAGEVASRIAVEAVARETAALPAKPRSNAADPLVRAFTLANREIRRRGRSEPEKRGMGTTLSVFSGNRGTSRGVIVHVGDSRVYRARAGRLEQLTRDHTWVQERIDAGVLTPEQARSHPYASILTRVLGTEERIMPDVFALDIEPGDIFLLCSDGLTGMVRDAEIEATLQREEPLEQLAERLVAMAKAGGGQDNVSLVLVRALHNG